MRQSCCQFLLKTTRMPKKYEPSMQALKASGATFSVS